MKDRYVVLLIVLSVVVLDVLVFWFTYSHVPASASAYVRLGTACNAGILVNVTVTLIVGGVAFANLLRVGKIMRGSIR